MNANQLVIARKARRERILRILKSSMEKTNDILPDGVAHHHHHNLKDNIKKKSSTNSNTSTSTSSSSTSSVFRDQQRNSNENFICSSHGSISVCGRRREMEDAITVEPGFLSKDFVKYDFFAVYDGHGGSRVAQACRDRLHQVLAKEIEDDHQDQHQVNINQQQNLNHNHNLILDGHQQDDEAAAAATVVNRNHDDEDEVLDWEKIMYSCFSKMDDEIGGSGTGIDGEIGSGSMKTIGSTAVVALLGKEKLIVANCGDSRAVLSRGGIAIPLSRDHKPDRPDEMERVEAAGGRVINWNGYRVLGVLATSRSIGDYYLKPYVISKPEVTVIERASNDEFLILASDGLWDVMSNETACEVVRKCLDGRAMRRLSRAAKGNNAGEAAAVLAELAIARGSKDNISVVVVELKKSGNMV